jgi:hypothetical protein
MSSVDTAALVILAMNGVALGVGIILASWIYALHRRARRLELFDSEAGKPRPVDMSFIQRPSSWLAIRAVSPQSVQMALGLNRFAPCSWLEGMTGGHEFFISPQVHGWVIVTGSGLPNPGDDVDSCFHFLVALSRRLGHVQFFHADRIVHYHAWARLDEGCVTRAFAWAGETVWSQGVETLPEIALRLKCCGYGEPSMTPQDAEANFEKVPLLAARWSLDPAEVNRRLARATGIAGWSATIY